MRAIERLVPLVASAVLLAGCSSETTTATTSTAPTTPPSTTATTAAPVEYQPAAHEPVPNGKKLGADIAVALTTYPASDNPAAFVKQRLQVLGVPDQFLMAAGPMMLPGYESVGKAIYPQLGGLTKDKTSMMVVTEQKLTAINGETRTITRTLDILLQTVDGQWRPLLLDSIGGEELARPDNLSDVAKKVLDNPKIMLPDSARWDIYRNVVDQGVLEQLDKLARDHSISVAVLSSGHPHNVFETNRLSNHTRGRAADIWAIDGVLVVDQRNDGLKALMQKILSNGVTELGGPFDIDGKATRSFTDQVHQDHLHLGLRLTRDLANNQPATEAATTTQP